MTTQVADTVRIHGADYLVCAQTAELPIDIQRFGLNPAAPSTACYRGWVAELEATDRLFLKTLYVFHDAGHPVKNRVPNGPAIEGVAPSVPKASMGAIGFNCAYEALSLPVAYTGGLLVGHDFIRSQLTGSLSHGFWVFKAVLELSLDKGQLVSVTDRSYVAEHVRAIPRQAGFLGNLDVLKQLPELRDKFDNSYSWLEPSEA